MPLAVSVPLHADLWDAINTALIAANFDKSFAPVERVRFGVGRMAPKL